MKAIDVRAGYGVKMDGKLWVIVGTEFRNPGKACIACKSSIGY